MSGDALVQKALADGSHGNKAAFQQDILNILRRDTDLSNPANKNPEHVKANLKRDGEALHKGGIDNATLRRLGFPVDNDAPSNQAKTPAARPPEGSSDPLMDKAKLDISKRDTASLTNDLIQILQRDAKAGDPVGTRQRLQNDHQALHAMGIPDETLEKLGFPMPEVNGAPAVTKR